jgi:hypothetical protein
VTLEDGTVVTPALVGQVFDEELERILHEAGGEADTGNPPPTATLIGFRQAAAGARRTFLQPELSDFFMEASELSPS